MDTTFVSGTTITSPWLNDVNTKTYHDTSSTVGYTPAGTGAVPTTVQAKLRESVSVLDFGADPTGVASATSAFQAAVNNGGTVYVPSGTYKLNSQLKINTNNTTLLLAANVTLNLSGQAANQNRADFGNQINVTANYCAVIGSGPSSLIQLTNGTQSNAIGLLTGHVFTVRDLTMDGGASTVAGFTDDTFGCGILILCTNADGATTDARATIDSVYMRNFFHYGVSMYGEQANGIKVVNCNIESMGVVGQATSVGGGIVCTASPTDVTLSNNVIKNCKSHGIFVSSAGLNVSNYVISGNVIHQNGTTVSGSGILIAEEVQYGSTVGHGTANVAITGNVCTGNGRAGVKLNVDTVGYITYVTITGNTLEGNTFAGLELGCTNTAPSIISNVMVSGNQVAQNGTYQIQSSPYVSLVEGVKLPFTPSISGTSSAGTGTYTSQDGSYIKVGSIVTFELDCGWSAHTGTGNIQVNGFPYATNSSSPISASWVWATGLTITGQATFGQTLNQTYGPLGAINNGAYSAVAMDTAAGIRITGSYFTN